MKKWWILGGSIIGCLVAAPVVFGVVVVLLNMIGKAFGMSYEMTNIVIYYILIPLIWLVMLVIFAYRAKKVLYWILVGIIVFLNYVSIDDVIRYLTKYGNEYSSALFIVSVDFLNNLPGSYVLASVYVCVIIPIIVFYVLYYLIVNKNHFKLYNVFVLFFMLFMFETWVQLGINVNSSISYYRCVIKKQPWD